MKNNCTFLEKLLDGAEVEWETLDEVFHLKNGYTPSKGIKEYWENGSIPWFRMEDIRENGRILNTALQKVSESAVKGGKLFPANSIIIATSATIGEHALITIPFLANQRFTVLSLKPEYIDKFNIYFLYHYCFTLDDWCQKNTTMSSFASVDMNGFRRFPIPIPPLPVQTEIVKILDALTALTSELTSELILRRKQYEYYREKLLSHNDSENSSQQKVDKDKLFSTSNIQWLHLNEIYKFQYGIGNKIPTIGGEYPVYGSNGIVGSHNEYNSEDAPVIGHIGAYAGIVNWAEGKHFVTYNGIICNKINDNVNSRYAYYLLLSQNFIDKANKASQPFISYDILNKCIVTVPPIEEQQRIVSILDKFETLTNSITEGLPLAIEQSQKRYEYYRELLLNFS